MARLPTRYVGRYVLEGGTPRAFTVYAFNKSDAEAMVSSAAREQLGDLLRGALCYGVERFPNPKENSWTK